MIEVTSETGSLGGSLDKGFERINAILGGVPKGVEKAMPNIISRAQTTAQAATKTEVTKVYHISKGDLMRDDGRYKTNIRLRTQTSVDRIVGEIHYSGYKIPLYRFNVTPKKPSPKSDVKVPINFGTHWAWVSPGAGVKAAQLRGRPKTAFKDAFIARMSSGHIGMFERSTTLRAPIKEFMAVSLPEMVGNTKVLSKVEAAAAETINKRTEAEISRILGGFK
jgi:flavin-binding protein dodecin